MKNKHIKNMSRECQHDSGGDCIICNNGVNACCGDDKQCEKCSSLFCRSCYDEKTVVIGKVQCKDAEFRCYSCRFVYLKDCTEEVDIEEFQCPRCSAEIVTDEDLVTYFLARYKITREVAESRYRKWIKKENE